MLLVRAHSSTRRNLPSTVLHGSAPSVFASAVARSLTPLAHLHGGDGGHVSAAGELVLMIT